MPNSYVAVVPVARTPVFGTKIYPLTRKRFVVDTVPLSRISTPHVVLGESVDETYETGVAFATGIMEWLATGVVVPSASKTVSAGITTEVLLCPKFTVRIDTPSLPRVVKVETRRLKRTDDS